MIFSQDRAELRKMYADAWQKHCDKRPLSPLESQIADVVEIHPEYHGEVSSDDLDRNFTPEGGQANPFLHMGLHLGIREQVSTNRPTGIAAVYQALVASKGDVHTAEHEMIECLAETLWEAQSQKQPPDEHKYLERLQRLCNKK